MPSNTSNTRQAEANTRRKNGRIVKMSLPLDEINRISAMNLAARHSHAQKFVSDAGAAAIKAKGDSAPSTVASAPSAVSNKRK
jgi:hypothetical protein